MDIQLKSEAEWQRIRPEQAAKANGHRAANSTGPKDLHADDLADLLQQDSVNK